MSHPTVLHEAAANKREVVLSMAASRLIVVAQRLKKEATGAIGDNGQTKDCASGKFAIPHENSRTEYCGCPTHLKNLRRYPPAPDPTVIRQIATEPASPGPNNSR
jgi:hypothetical protein